MSTSAEKRARKKRHQRGQLMFLIHAMSIDDLIKYGLMKEEDRPDRPDDKELLRNLDQRIAQFWKAHGRMTKGSVANGTGTMAEVNRELRLGRRQFVMDDIGSRPFPVRS